MNKSTATPTKRELQEAWAALFSETHRNWTVLAATTRFNAAGLTRQDQKYLAEHNKVVGRIRRVLLGATPSIARRDRVAAMPLGEFAFYECNIVPLRGSSPIGLPWYRRGAVKPHHVHAAIPVPTELLHRVFDTEKSMPTARVVKAVEAMESVADFRIEPARSIIGWVKYCTKEVRDTKV